MSHSIPTHIVIPLHNAWLLADRAKQYEGNLTTIGIFIWLLVSVHSICNQPRVMFRLQGTKMTIGSKLGPV
jgi:hypothetical protein